MNSHDKTQIDARQYMMIQLCRRFMYMILIINNDTIYVK